MAQTTPIGLQHADKYQRWAASPETGGRDFYAGWKRNPESKELSFPRSVLERLVDVRHFLSDWRKLLPSALRFVGVSSGGGRSGCVLPVLESRDGGSGFGCPVAAPWGFPLLPLPRYYSQP